MSTSDNRTREDVLADLQGYSDSFKTLGIGHEYNADGTIEELETALTIAKSFFGSVATNVIEERDEDLEPIPITLTLLSDFIKDVSPEPKKPIAELTAIANHPQDELEPSEKFENGGLYAVCEILGEQHLAINTNDWDPYDTEYCLKLAFEKLNLDPVPEKFADEIEDKLLDFDDLEEQEDYVWHSTVKLVDNRGYELLELTPLGGIWSDKVLFIIKKERASKWTNKAFGDYGLVSLTAEYLDMEFE